MAVVLVILLVLLSAALLAPGLLIGPSLDAAVFSHVAGRLLDGAPLYLGAWDHKPPGIYLAQAAGQAILGWLGPWTADWLLSVAATAAIGLAVAATLARLGLAGAPRALAAVGVVALAGQYLLALGGGLSEPIATALVAWALVYALSASGRWQAAAVGALLGAALLVSLLLLPGALVVAVLAVAGAPASARVARGGALLAGLAAPIAAVSLWLAAIGALPATVDAVVGYSAAYRGAGGAYGFSLGAPVAAWTVLTSLFLLAPALLGSAFLLRAAGLQRRIGVAALVWFTASCLLVLVQGRYYAHYAIPMAVPLAILAGFGILRLQQSLRATHTSASRAVVLAAPAAALAISLVAATIAAAMQMAPLADRSSRMQAVSQWLGNLPAKAGRLLVWGNEPRLYDLARREPALRFSYLYPLTTPGYATMALIGDVARDLAADPPSVVVDASSDEPGAPGFLPLLSAHPVAREGRELDLLAPLRAFVVAHYRLAATVEGWPIYLLRDNRTAP